ncbi:chromosome segregation protein SMC [Pseudomonas cannabina]|uniref:Chromosome partition protein Smc n=1 Tax=Pseudomonas syringae pv. maculicola str. ES4326 TaxID=629265 RepID=A0A8T8C2Q2_PSEYM|nr:MULTISPECIES: chromosome segregation protein SMC [Pseudomonas syringae group]KPB69703.1 Chromosome partition protein Smc [Pseudomonas syringae pv. maculicola]QHE97890.1 chromosome segregation protein SMC [Pseudomonas syringae pv. maculicola str. ES4326]QQN23875.1 chromosome segregation protein SMC [Pseudomonas cannabina pv. alisalensis]UBY98559.1 chromosome segregation protein SMC [Pseudomonas cannabina pv. alisalensis]
MRLKCIKLAGFKSFVDPTTVNFPSNMAAVVGPNGCGKSNIIDAVRWVMGESSAKNLRGESMTDVIFNGSTSRKPVSQASIELAFDNSDGTLVGEYAAYAEISIRRKVTRDSQNSYYLNGTKCRRRDITDIFLGTGLGPRSYSIIEQGMISKLIEAKPEDLRNFIEEAAGISKYKERRRETENRIRRTHENLARLTDLREELERQLERLHRQAQAAEKYQEYKAEERQLKAQLSALRWQALNEQVGQREAVIGNQEVGFEALVADQRSADASIERLRDGHHDLSERFNLVQGRFYSVGGDIARVEQSIQHGQQRLRQLQDDLREAERARLETESHLGHDTTLLATLGEELEMLEPEQEMTSAAAEESAIALEDAEAAMQGWQEKWDAFNQQSAEPQRQAQVQQSRIQQLEQSIERLAERQRRLAEERQLLAADPEDAAILELSEDLATRDLTLEELHMGEEQAVERLEQLREALQNASQAQQQAQGELQRLNGRLASLEALQQAALDPDTGTAEWLRDQQLTERPRLAEGLSVEAGWELAVETVLGADLQAVLVDDFDGLDLAGFQQGDLRLLSAGADAVRVPGSLLEKVESTVDLSAWLGQVFPVENLDEALARRTHLSAGQSLISRDGYWVGRHFLRVRRASEAQSGVLARGQELQRLGLERDEREATLATLEEQLLSLREQQSQQEDAREQLRRRVQDETRQQSELKAQLSAAKVKVEQLTLRRARLDEELAELAEQRAAEHEQLGESRLQLQDALDAMAQDTEQREVLQAQRDSLRERLDRIRQDARQHKDHSHQLAVRLGSIKAQYDSTRQALERLRMQSERLTEKREQLSLNLEEGEAPLEELRLKLEELLERRMVVDDEMRIAKNALEDADRELREAEKRRTQAEQQAQLLRGQLEQQRLEWQSLTVRRTALQDQLQEDGYDLHGVLATLTPEASEQAAEQQLESIAGRIQRLGAINLAAIDEYQQQSERKRYLDAQDADLVEALDTLENVIRKIDKETRNRFKDTFDQINSGIQALFPKVFGGGSAYLELTGEDLLDTGVTIMARPPGKKNSTIHLLSGGEKALTALALVFAIFKLNPAPFCMLDEVDAPLDDANVGRYARLVKEMSQTVQFIYITHNKIAMEMADQLMGVTMHEPGCSRLVAVDVEEAMALVDA